MGAKIAVFEKPAISQARVNAPAATSTTFWPLTASVVAQ
jgi:hypothetical protein